MAGMEVMREFVSRQYGGRWPERVKKMPNEQVARIYYRMIDELDNIKKKKSHPKFSATEVCGGVQLSLFKYNKGTKIKEEYLL